MHTLPSLDGQETERLLFRKLTPADVEPWMEFHRSAAAIKHLGYALNDRATCEAIVGKQIWRYAFNNSGLRAVLLKESNALIGLCGLLTQEVNGTEEWEIGYHLIERYWGKGYATEAAIAHREAAFANSEVPSIVSLIHPTNTPSQKVAERNGMVKGEKAQWRDEDVEVWRVHLP